MAIKNKSYVLMRFVIQIVVDVKYSTNYVTYPILGREYLMSFYLKVRLLVLLLSYRVHWESPGQRLTR